MIRGNTNLFTYGKLVEKARIRKKERKTGKERT
jgi:hypothetical protein